MITQERLKEVLNYDPDTGVFTWKTSTNNFVKVGQVAGSENGQGYIQIKVDGERYLIHRLAWVYVYGELPTNCIDHIDRNRSNNAIGNLREATSTQNAQNRTQSQKGKVSSKHLGVYWRKIEKRWISSIRVAGKLKHLGYFNTEEEAAQAYISAKRRFHEYCTI